MAMHVIQATDPEGAVRWPLLGQGNSQREFVGCNGHPSVVCRLEDGRPFMHRHRPGLVKASAQNRLGRFVVEHEGPLGVHDENGHDQVTGELAGQNHFDLLLGGHPRQPPLLQG